MVSSVVPLHHEPINNVFLNIIFIFSLCIVMQRRNVAVGSCVQTPLTNPLVEENEVPLLRCTGIQSGTPLIIKYQICLQDIDSMEHTNILRVFSTPTPSEVMSDSVSLPKIASCCLLNNDQTTYKCVDSTQSACNMMGGTSSITTGFGPANLCSWTTCPLRGGG